MSSPESIINSLYRAGNLSARDIQRILTSFQGLPKQVDEDTDRELIVYSPETRKRSISFTINPGPGLLTPVRNRDSNWTYIREIPSIVNVYPLDNTPTGTFTQASSLIYGAGMQTDGASYIDVSDATRLNPTTNISFGGWFKAPATETGDSWQSLFSKDAQYGFFIRRHIDGVNQVYPEIFTTTQTFQQTADFTYTPDTWTHVWATYSTGDFKFYVNGSLIDTNTTPVGNLDTTSNGLSFFRKNDTSLQAKAGVSLAWWSAVNGVTNSTWVSNHHAGILDTNSNSEIFTYPFEGTVTPRPDASVGRCQIN